MQNFISIPKPCNENWDAMTPQEQGRHCDKCNIVVQDFSAMSNEDILGYVKKATTNFCGRFNPKQLVLNTSISEKLRKFIYAFAFSFLPVFAVKSNAQELKSLQPIEIEQTGGFIGQVKDSENIGIEGAKISVYKNDRIIDSTYSNENGHYSVNNLKESEYRVVIEKNYFIPIEVKNIMIQKGILLFKDFQFSTPANETLYIIDGLIVNDHNYHY